MSATIESLTLSPKQAAAFIGIGKTKMLDLIRAKRVKVSMLDGRIRVSTEACKAFINSLPNGYVKGKPVYEGETAPTMVKPKRAPKAVRP